MKTMSQKSLLLFGAVLAMCAFGVPSMASAASWSVIGTTHQLASPNLAFDTGSGITLLGSSCADSEFHADVASASTLEITGGAFRNCSGTGLAAGCTVTATGQKFPWTATAPATNNIQIHGIHVHVTFENRPGSSACGFPANGLTVTLTGTLTGGTYDPSGVGADRRVTYNNATGVFAHNPVTGSPQARVNGQIRDTTGTLNLTD